jgi:hypothetical protein
VITRTRQSSLATTASSASRMPAMTAALMAFAGGWMLHESSSPIRAALALVA